MDNWTNIISKATYDYIRDTEIDSLDDIKFVKTLNDIILSEKIINFHYKYNHKVSLKESNKLVEEFMNSISNEYLEYYRKRKDENIFVYDYDLLEDYPYSSYDNISDKRIIYIPIYNNIEDSYSIVHELIHDMNLDLTGENIARYMFTESLSILGEMLFEDFLKNKHIVQYKNPTNYSLYSVNKKAFEVDFNIKLLESYLNNNYLAKDSIIKILKNYTSNQVEELNEVLSRIIENEELTYENESRYIIGFLIATYMYDRIRQNKNNINEFFELNDMLSSCETDDILNYLDLDYNDYELTNDSYKKLKMSYKNYLKSR